MHEEHAQLLQAVDPAVLGARVRAARTSRGLTQTELAGDGVSTGYVSRIESGTRRPTLAVLRALAARLDTSVDHLLRGMSGSAYDELRLALSFAELALENGDAVEAETQARSVAERAAQAGDTPSRERAEVILARALENQGRLNDAIEALEDVAGRASGLVLIEAGIALSRCYREAGDLTLAIEAGERVEDAVRRAGLDGTDHAVRLAVTVAAAYIERGDVNRAARRCRRAVETAERLGTPAARSAAYWNSSIVHAKRGETAAAAQLAARALALLAEGDDARNLARLRTQVARLMLRDDLCEVTEAMGQAERARHDLTTSSASSTDLTLVDLTLAQAHLRAGEPRLALDIATGALARCPEDALLNRIEAWTVLGQARFAVGQRDAALDAYAFAATALEAVGGSRAAAQLWFDLARLLDAADAGDAARDAYRRSAESMGLHEQAGRLLVQPTLVQQQ